MSGIERMSLGTLTELIEQYLPIQKWGLRENIRLVLDSAELCVIYNSELCRIKFLIEREMFTERLNVYYGRLHAPNDDWKMTWNGDECYCWHHYGELHLLFSFLDGVSVQEAYKANISWLYEKRKRIWHPLIESHLEYVEKHRFETKERSFGAQLEFHASIWEHYGLRFFELFDLRHPELWEKYRNFLREVYEPEEQRYKGKGVDLLSRYQVC